MRIFRVFGANSLSTGSFLVFGYLILFMFMISSCSKDEENGGSVSSLPALYAIVVAEGESANPNADAALFTINDINKYSEEQQYLLLSKQLTPDSRWDPSIVPHYIRFYAGKEFLFEAIMNQDQLAFGFNLFFISSNQNGTFLQFEYDHLIGKYDDSAFAPGLKKFCKILKEAGKLDGHKVDFENRGISYKITDKEKYEVEVTYGDLRYEGNVTIPEKVSHDGHEYTVTAIGESAFQYCSGLSSVTLPNTLRIIGKTAFLESSLSSINLPNGLETIGVSAFMGCVHLAKINIPQTVTQIENSAFNSCMSLTSIALPTGLKAIGARAFVLCTALQQIELPSGLTRIEEETFDGCSELTKVLMADGIETIGNSAFYNCKKLEKVRLPEGLKAINNFAFYDCVTLAEISFPDGLESIGESAFRSCPLDNIELPASLKEIGKKAFGCYYTEPTGILNLMISHIQEPFPIENLFENRLSFGAELRVPKGTKEKYQALEPWSYFHQITEME